MAKSDAVKKKKKTKAKSSEQAWKFYTAWLWLFEVGEVYLLTFVVVVNTGDTGLYCGLTISSGKGHDRMAFTHKLN